MARFTQKSARTNATPNTINDAGGDAFKQSPKLAFASAILTSMVTDPYYKSADAQVSDIALMAATLQDPLFIAKAAIYTRKQNGLRSVSHIVAGELAKRVDVKGQPWLRKFFSSVVNRPDDITETLSYLQGHGVPNLRKLSNALKRGFGDALARFDEYQLAKYRGEGKDLNLYDVVSMLHPKGTPAIEALMTGSLKPAETWETKLSQAGKTGESKDTAKSQAWKDLLGQHKLGYLAALRNLRNIQAQAPEAMPLALQLLTDPKQVAKSLILPFQILTAVETLGAAATREVKVALDKAMELSLSNVPRFDGKTLIAVDVSGSMRGRPVQIASLLASVLFKTNDADVMLFDTDIRHLNLHPGDSLSSLSANIQRNVTGGGTDFNLIFIGANRAYDRIIILSDMQAWVNHGWNPSTPLEAHKVYKKVYGCDPRIYSFDLNGSGTMQFPESRVYALAGFSDSVLKVMQNLEVDPQALVHAIEAIEL